jgi:hypothetical protein
MVIRKITYVLFAYLVVLLAINISPAKAVSITSISQNASNIGKYQKFEVTFTLDKNYPDNNDPCVVDIMVIFDKPDSSTIQVPAFYYVEYTENTYGNYVSARNPCWKVRLAPAQIGAYSINNITIIDSNGTSILYPSVSFTCVESNKKGFIRTSRNDPHYMQFDNNNSYMPIGHDVCWWNASGTNAWKTGFTKMHNAGENWTRIWMCPFSQGTALEWNKNFWTGYYNGVGKYSMPIAWRLDRIIESCEQNDIYAQLTFEYVVNAGSDWNDHPYNIINGGPISTPSEFFTDANAIRLTKNKYRYIIARWGYSTSILTWELWNEVQFSDGWNNNPSSVVNWHNTMASYIRNLDPFKHFITTSSHSYGFENFWNLPDINLVEVHYYGSDSVRGFEQMAMAFADFNKPIIIAEFGGAPSTASIFPPEGSPSALPEPFRSQIYEGLGLHNGIWSSFHSKSSAHLWWWDNYIDPCNLYSVFTPLAIYAADENLADYNLTRAQHAIAGTQRYFAFPALYDFGAISSQSVFTLQDDYFPGMKYLSLWLQGAWHPTQKSDPTFNLNMPSAGNLKIHIDDISGSGTNGVRVLVNGSQVFSSNYPNDAENFIISAPLPAGQQSVQIKNNGNDWFITSGYEFVPSNSALLDSIGLSNKKRAYIWIYDVNSQYGQINNGIFHNQPIIIKGLDDGSYLVEIYATRGAGGIINSGTANSVAGQLSYTLPDFSKDIAVKATRIVNFRDFAAFASQWQQTGSNLSADLNHDSSVNLTDLSVITGSWLQKYPAGWPF